MVKVTMITGNLPPDKCGVGDYTNLLCNELSKNDIKLDIITSCKNSKVNKSINVCNDIEDWSIKSIWKILRSIDKVRPDIVHIQYPTKSYGRKLMINILPMILKLKKYKVITTLHEYSDNSMLGKIRANINIMFSDLIIVVDLRYKMDINNTKLLRNKKVEYINIASNIPKSIISEEEKQNKKNDILKGSNKKIMSYFGFIHERKGVESILTSMKLLKDRNEFNLVFLIIAELKESDEYHKILLNLIKDLGLQKDIIITGYLGDYEVADFLNISDFVVLPFSDGFSPKNGSVLAALQEGKEVITTKSKFLKQHFNNLLFIDKYDSIEQLTELINKKQNENNKETLVQDNTFNWHYVAEGHIKLYEKNN